MWKKIASFLILELQKIAIGAFHWAEIVTKGVNFANENFAEIMKKQQEILKVYFKGMQKNKSITIIIIENLYCAVTKF